MVGARPDAQNWNPASYQHPSAPQDTRDGAEASFRGTEKVEIKHQNLTHRDRCTECGKGNVYAQKEGKVLVRLIGQAPLAATVHSLERLRSGKSSRTRRSGSGRRGMR